MRQSLIATQRSHNNSSTPTAMTSPSPSPSPTPSPQPSLWHRNSISTTVPLPTKLTIPTKSSSVRYGDDSASSFELMSLESPSSSYTSLKDLLPSSSVNSPVAGVSGTSSNSAYGISIRNRLVKQAAWAYLRPMSASSPYSSSSGSHFLYRIWIRISSACFQIINRILSVFQVKENEFNQVNIN